jgi:hypothetical protein
VRKISHGEGRARQHHLPEEYIQTIEAVDAIEDPDKERDARNRRIAC